MSVGEFDNPQQFMDSEYNQSGDKDGKIINCYGFIQGYILSNTSEQYNVIRIEFIDISKNGEYDTFKNNCATAVQRSLNEVVVNTKFYDCFNGLKIRFNSIIPSSSFEDIKINNPIGVYIRSRKK